MDPPSVIEDQMIQFLVTAQYETAVVKDIHHLQKVLADVPNAIIYFNLDSRTAKLEQEALIIELLTSDENNYCIGFLSYDKNEELAEKYLIDFGASGGYITLDLGFKKSAQILLTVLEATEARGDRKFVRVRVPRGKGTLNFTIDSGKRTGQIIDISSVGMACSLEGSIPKGSAVPSIQMVLWGNIVTLGGTIAGSRDTDGGAVTVIMFDNDLKPETRSKIYAFLRRIMQYEVDVRG